LVLAVPALSQTINTVAGGGAGDGGPATSANLNDPASLALDASGNLYIADLGNVRIRKVDAALGIITTVAGNGVFGFAGDGGAATSASLNSPAGVALDASGNLYIAEYANHRIRKVDAATGIITTVAGNGINTFAGDGGAATSASLSHPNGVALDASGNLYIADYGNSRIRKVAAATGIITTVTGNGVFGFAGDGGAATSASLSSPIGVALDGSGNLYIVDYLNHRIRKVTAATGIITTVAGNGSPAFAGDGGAATSASLNYPSGVALDASGNLYIADYFNRRIRKVTAATGIITTVAGNGSFGFAGDDGAATSASLERPTGVALDASGNLYIADTFNYRIRKVDAASGIITTVAGNGNATFAGDGGAATSASLYGPTGVALDASGNLYIADRSNQRIRKVDAASGIITTVAGNGFSGFAGDDGAATSASLNEPFGVALDASGNLYIADNYNHRIRMADAASGIITTVVGNGFSGFAGDDGAATSASLYFPTGVALDASGNLYIADPRTQRIRKVDAASGIITTVAGNGVLGFAGDGGPATSANLASPSGVALDASGNLYIADIGNERIRKVDAASGIITTAAGSGVLGFAGDDGAATSASLASPWGVALDASGNLYIADYFNHRIRKVDATTGIITTVAGNGTATFAGDGGAATSANLNYPVGVAVDASGNLYIADFRNQRIRKVIF
jgi:sugar lactone lactonase YvrE